MKPKIIILIITQFLIIIGIIYVYQQSNNQSIQKETKELPKAVQEQANQTQIDEKGDVIIRVTPKVLKPEQQAQFEIVFDTHSVELDYDIVNITSLTDDKGNSYQPINWTGGKGGHHLSGTLSFSNISKNAQSITLKFSQIDNYDRVFIWNLT